MNSPDPPNAGDGWVKRPRTEDELAEVVKLYAATWKPGDRVMTWLKEHEGRKGELSRLIDLGWSWAEIARALSLAGIGYRTGRPFDGDTLCTKAVQARTDVRRNRLEARRPGRPRKTEGLDSGGALPLPPAREPQAPFEKPALSREAPANVRTSLPEEPRFRPVTLAGGRKLPPPQEPPQMKTPPVVVEATDDEIIAELFGSKRRS